MTQCNHDSMFTHDGRCSKCYPPRRYARIVMVQHIDGTVEVDSRFAMTAERVAAVQPLVEETMRRYHDYTAQLSDDEIALMQAMCNETAHDEAL